MNNNWKDFLQKQYSTPGASGAFSSAGKLFKIVKDAGYDQVKKSDIQEWLNNEYTYVIHKKRKINYPRNQIIATGIDHIWQADILFLNDISTFNDRKPCALLCIDVISRFMWGEMMMSKKGTATAKAFETILRRSNGRCPQKLQTDKGKEFYNKHFQDVMDKYNIILYSTESDKKAAIAERCIKELKKLIYRFMTHNQTNRYIDVFQKLIETYNNTHHSSIGMPPSAANKSTEGQIIENLYGHFWKKDTATLQSNDKKFNIGDLVRISLKKDLFTKGYKGFWTTEVFTIDNVKKMYPYTMYRLQDSDGEILTGLFYETELQKVLKSTHRFTKIQKIWRRKRIQGKKWVLVSWENEGNIKRWIPENLIS